MNLKNLYNANKNTQQAKQILGNIISWLSSFIIGLASIAVCLFICMYIWNLAAPAWGLPVLNYVEFAATYVMLFLIKMIFFPIKMAKRSSADILQILNNKGTIDEG